MNHRPCTRHLTVAAITALFFTTALGHAAETPDQKPADAVRKNLQASQPEKNTELVPMPPLTWASEKIKNIHVAGPTKVSFGLEHQTRYESWANRFLPGRTYTNDVVFYRTRAWMDWDFHKHVRLFAEFQDAQKESDSNYRGRFWENRADLLEAYVDFRHLFGQDLTLRVGRQPLVYGKQRLVGAFEWSNPGRRFDAIKLMWKNGDKTWQVDGFASKVVVVHPIKADESHPTEEFYGAHATNHSLKDHHFDLYYFGRYDNKDQYTDELGRTGELAINTLGFRAWGAEFWGGLDYEVELAGQFGHTGKAHQESMAAHAELGWTFDAPWSPRLMLEGNYASGDDDPTDGENNTFNNLFPTNHLHYGYIDYFNWSNTVNGGLGVTASPLKGVTLWAKGWYFWLAEKKDAWRNAGGAALGRDVTGGSGRNVGFEFDVGGKAQLNKHINLNVGYSLFDGDDYVQQVRNSAATRGTKSDGEFSQFFYAQFVFKF